MKFSYPRFRPGRPAMLAAAVLSVALASCGGSSGGGGGSNQSAGVGGTGIVAGKATGFGSIFVNGMKYETPPNTQFIVDGDETSATQDDLEVGMYVLLRVSTLNGAFTNEALEVFYDDEVQGPVVGISGTASGETQRTFTVFGQNVTIDETSTIFNGRSFADLANNEVVEISGFRTAANAITATYVEFKEVLTPGVTKVELRGTITGPVSGVFPNQSFQVDGVTIDTDMSTTLELDGGILQTGLYVEVEGIYQVGGSVLASEVEEEDQGFGSEVDDVSLQGVISNWGMDIDDPFEIDGQVIDASGAVLSPANAASLLDNGVEIEVEGDIVGGVLIADELELRDGESELRTTIRTRDLVGSRIELEFPGFGDNSLGTVWVNVDDQTLFQDESAASVPNLSLNQLNPGDFVKVKGIAVVNPTTLEDEVNAEIVKRRDPGSVKLEGAVQAFDGNPAPDTSITILSIAYPIDATAEYEGGTQTRVQFFGTPLLIGDIVELEDDEPDGDADEVEFDD